MAISCAEIWRHVSDFLDDDLAPELRSEIEDHLEHCRRCTAVVDGIHNVIVLTADERTFSLPIGFSARLQKRIREEFLRDGQE